MKRFLFAVLILAPALVFATPITWAPISGSKGVQGTCTAAATCERPAGAPTSTSGGLLLGTGITAVDVQICPPAGGTVGDGDGFFVYFYDAGAWAKGNVTAYVAPTSSVVDECVQLQFDSPGKGYPIIGKRGWMVVVPVNATTGLTIKLLPSGALGAL